MKAPLSTSREYLFARLHGLWGGMFQGQLLQELLAAKDIASLTRLLAPHGLTAASPAAFQKALLQRELAMLTRVQAMLDESLAAYYATLLKATAFFHDVKVVFACRLSLENPDDLAMLLLETEGIRHERAQAALASSSDDEFLQQLLPEELTPRFHELLQTRDFTRIVNTLDALALEERLNAAKRLANPARDHAVTLVQEEIDHANIAFFLRNRQFYNLSAEQLHAFWLNGGTLSAPTSEKDIDLLNRSVPPKARLFFSTAQRNDLSQLEQLLQNERYKHAHALFRKETDARIIAVAFPVLLHSESTNLGRLYEGIRLTLPPRDIMDMMTA